MQRDSFHLATEHISTVIRSKIMSQVVYCKKIENFKLKEKFVSNYLKIANFCKTDNRIHSNVESHIQLEGKILAFLIFICSK